MQTIRVLLLLIVELACVYACVYGCTPEFKCTYISYGLSDCTRFHRRCLTLGASELAAILDPLSGPPVLRLFADHAHRLRAERIRSILV